jgi:hypothetical protein
MKRDRTIRNSHRFPAANGIRKGLFECLDMWASTADPTAVEGVEQGSPLALSQ